METYGDNGTSQISIVAFDERVLVYSHQALHVGCEVAAALDEVDLSGAIVVQRVRADPVVTR